MDAATFFSLATYFEESGEVLFITLILACAMYEVIMIDHDGALAAGSFSAQCVARTGENV